MDLLHTMAAYCPYCDAQIELVVDASISSQDYIEDCEVCCQPIRVQVCADDPESPTLQLLREDD